MTNNRVVTKPAVNSVRKRSLAIVLSLVICSLTACDTGTNSKELKELAGSNQARQAREETQKHLLAIVNSYDRETPLALGMVTLNDTCAGGTAELFNRNGNDRAQDKIACSMSITAYYAANPRYIGDVLDGIFTAGDDGVVPFSHKYPYQQVLDFYRRNDSNSSDDSQASEVSTLQQNPQSVKRYSQTLSWDTVRAVPKRLLSSQNPCVKNDPPVERCTQTPKGKTVTSIRKKSGMVFKLDISTTSQYFTVSKDDETSRPSME